MELDNADKIEKRCKRYDVPGHGHELTFRCYRRMPLLKNPTFCGYLAEAVRRTSTALSISIQIL